MNMKRLLLMCTEDVQSQLNGMIYHQANFRNDVKARIGKTAGQAFISMKPVWRSTPLHSACGTTSGFSTPNQSSQCFCMAQRLGELRKGFPTNYRHSSKTTYAGSLVTEDQTARIVRRSNKELTTVGNEPTKKLSLNKYALEGSGDGLGIN
ncbi:unnamed protein product [Heterobilharzia americana]|nr:unnamed protein product [Heterobilharzia americana]